MEHDSPPKGLALVHCKNLSKFSVPKMLGEKSKRIYRAIPLGHMLRSREDKVPTLNSRLNEELRNAYSLIRLSEEEMDSRRDVLQSFKKVLESELDCTVEPYGSFKTGLMVYESDIDITILTSENARQDGPASKSVANSLLARACAVLEGSGLVSGPILHIKNARCPIIKCRDLTHKYKVDISVNKYDAMETAEFVLQQIRNRPYLRCILTLIKYFLKRRQLSETIRGGLCSYGQFLMVLNFVQLHPLIQGGNISVEDNLGTILMDFFQFYGSEFPFERAVISVADVRYRPNRDSQINIDDPVSPGHNVAWGCNALHMIREVFNYSYRIMAAAFANKVATNKAVGELWLRIDNRELAARKKARH